MTRCSALIYACNHVSGHMNAAHVTVKVGTTLPFSTAVSGCPPGFVTSAASPHWQEKMWIWFKQESLCVILFLNRR